MSSNDIYQLYYTYQLIDPRSNTTFYIGFAKDLMRPYDHLAQCQNWLAGKKVPHPNYIKLAKIRDIINEGYEFKFEIVYESSDPDQAYNKEVELITKYGRQDLNTGFLSNMNAGGRGCLNPSDEVRKRISDGNSGTLVERWGEERAEKQMEFLRSQSKEMMSDRGLKGAKHIIDNGWSKESIDKRRKSRLLGTVKRIQDHYLQPYTEELRIRARKDKVAFVDKVALSKYITEEDIRQLSYCGKSTAQAGPLHSQ